MVFSKVLFNLFFVSHFSVFLIENKKKEYCMQLIFFKVYKLGGILQADRMFRNQCHISTSLFN